MASTCNIDREEARGRLRQNSRHMIAVISPRIVPFSLIIFFIEFSFNHQTTTSCGNGSSNVGKVHTYFKVALMTMGAHHKVFGVKEKLLHTVATDSLISPLPGNQKQIQPTRTVNQSFL